MQAHSLKTNQRNTSVTKDTYQKVFDKAGGVFPFIVITLIMCFQHYWAMAEQINRAEWGSGSFEDQQDKYA